MASAMNCSVPLVGVRPHVARSSAQRAAKVQAVSLRSSFLQGEVGCRGTGALSKHVQLSGSRTAGSRKVTAMAAKVTGLIKLALNAGKANPAPPVGPALGAKGVNIMAFCKEYNAATQDKVGTVIPVEITVYEDRSFTFILKTPPASVLLKKAVGIEKGSGKPKTEKVGTVTRAQLEEVAKVKMPDLNAVNLEGAIKIIEGTARNMGLTVVD